MRVKDLLLLLLLCSPVTVYAVDIPNQLKFAESLADENDHYRAITEYKRFIFLEPDSPLVPKAKLSIAASFIAGKRWEQADLTLENLISLHPESSEATNAQHMYADIAYERGEFGIARGRYRSLAKVQSDSETINYTNFRIGWTFLEQDKPLKAKTHFSLMPSQQKALLLKDLDAYQSLPQKAPLLAGTLSAVVPGAGQLYTGRLRQAAISFLLNGAFVLGAIEAFQNGNYTVGSVFLFFEIGWYGGNIFNAVNNAHKYNIRIKQEFKKQMRSRLNLKVGLLKQTPFVTFNYQF